MPYLDGGRDFAVGLDCWGLVRHVSHHVFNSPLFEGFGCVDRYKSDAMHQGYEDIKGGFKECKPKAGALACSFLKSGNNWIFHHAGICISPVEVMHTSSTHGVKVMPVRAFKRLALVVKFYEYSV